MAKTLIDAGSPELLEKALDSPDFKHRTAAAIALGLNQIPNESLLEFHQDSHGMVAPAARESGIINAFKKHQKKEVDFGPFFDTTPAERKAAADLWRSWFKMQVVPVPAPKKGGEVAPRKIGGFPKANPPKVEPVPLPKEPKEEPSSIIS